MPDKLSVLCVHGTGHGDDDALLAPSWAQAITENLQRWRPKVTVTCDFLRYDDLFDHAPLNPVTYREAVAKLLASGVIHGSGDLFSGSRGLLELPEQIRWTAGMIAQWSSEDGLRAALRNRVLSQMNAAEYGVVCAHSLGSMICYDTFRRNAGIIKNKVFVTLGSQIGNPFVRDCFAGRIEPVDARMWYNLFNSDDHVFTAQLRVTAANFAEIIAKFDKPDDVLNNDPLWYFNHDNTRSRVWFDISTAAGARERKSKLATVPAVVAPPERRALLIGINAYANPANRLEGCVNDTFLMSSVLQESGFLPEEIRVVLDERATTAGILERLHWLLDDVRGGDERLLFFSGHGAQIPAYGERQEVDHLDECLVPYDFDWSIERAITDKQFVKFYSQLPYDARFVAIFDCCHAGGLSRDGGLRARGLNPPDDIRHRALRWNASFGMWEEREIEPPNRSLARSEEGKRYLGRQGVSYRLGRGVSLRTLPNQKYDRERKALGHLGAYLPIIFEACQEQELSYEYRDGANSYGAFTFCIAKVLREVRAKGTNPNFSSLTRLAGARLRALGYQQIPTLLGPHAILRKPVPWVKPRSRRK